MSSVSQLYWTTSLSPLRTPCRQVPALVIIVLLLAAAQCSATVTNQFNNLTTYPSGGSPNQIVAGDFNGMARRTLLCSTAMESSAIWRARAPARSNQRRRSRPYPRRRRAPRSLQVTSMGTAMRTLSCCSTRERRSGLVRSWRRYLRSDWSPSRTDCLRREPSTGDFNNDSRTDVW